MKLEICTPHNIEIMMGSEIMIVLIYLRGGLRLVDLRGGSYEDSLKQLKNKKATINLGNNDDNCFQYALTVALNHALMLNQN